MLPSFPFNSWRAESASCVQLNLPKNKQYSNASDPEMRYSMRYNWMTNWKLEKIVKAGSERIYQNAIWDRRAQIWYQKERAKTMKEKWFHWWERLQWKTKGGSSNENWENWVPWSFILFFFFSRLFYCTKIHIKKYL